MEILLGAEPFSIGLYSKAGNGFRSDVIPMNRPNGWKIVGFEADGTPVFTDHRFHFWSKGSWWVFVYPPGTTGWKMTQDREKIAAFRERLAKCQ